MQLRREVSDHVSAGRLELSTGPENVEINACPQYPKWTDLQQVDPVIRSVHWSRASAVASWLGAAKLGRLVLSQFVRCEQFLKVHFTLVWPEIAIAKTNSWLHHWIQQDTMQPEITHSSFVHSKNPQLLAHHHSLCSKPRLHIWWTPHLFWPDLICLQKSWHYHIRHLRCIRLYLDSKTASTIATSTSIVHSKLDYCNSLYHNLPKSQITRLQQIQNSLVRAVVKAPKSSHITPTLRSLHWLKINEHIEYKLLSLTGVPTKFSQPTNLHICMTSSQFSLLAALALHPWSHSLVHPHHHLYEKQIVPSSRPMLPFDSRMNSSCFTPSTAH